MPIKRTVWDKGDPTKDEPARTHEMWDIDAREAVANGQGRFCLTKPPGFGAPPPPPRRGATGKSAAKEPAPVNDDPVPTE